MLNSFWLLPLIFGNISNEINEITQRGLFGDFLFDLTHAFTIFDSSWTNSIPNTDFIKQPIFWYFWIIPTSILVSFTIKTVDKKIKNNLIFFLIISLIGIFLTKQSGPPFSNTYLLLYKYLPGFSFFREASKFYLLTSFGYMGLLSCFLLIIKQKQINYKISFYYFIVIIITSLSLWNFKPLITGEIKTLFVSRTIPNDYKILEKFLSKQSSFFRTLLITESRWSYFSLYHPYVNSPTNYLNVNNKQKLNDYNFIFDLLNSSFTNNLLDNSTIKYLIISLKDYSDNEFINYYKYSNEEYIYQLNKIKFLKKINIGTKNIAIYENENFKPKIYLTNNVESIYDDIPYSPINYLQINSTKYSLDINTNKNKFFINFSETFNNNWKLYFGNANMINILFNKYNYLSEQYHFKNDAKLNSFFIDTNQICKLTNCQSNKSYRYKINFTLIYYPQIYMELGKIISFLTLISLFIILIYEYIKSKNSHSNTHS